MPDPGNYIVVRDERGRVRKCEKTSHMCGLFGLELVEMGPRADKRLRFAFSRRMKRSEVSDA